MPPPAPCSRHLLVVEDDLATREALALILRADGYRVTTAADGLRALQRLENGERPSLIVLDLMMPVMDGWQFREEQRADPRFADIPVLVCSAAGNLEQRAACLQAVACLSKPIEVTDLLAAIRRACPPVAPTSG